MWGPKEVPVVILKLFETTYYIVPEPGLVRFFTSSQRPRVLKPFSFLSIVLTISLHYNNVCKKLLPATKKKTVITGVSYLTFFCEYHTIV